MKSIRIGGSRRAQSGATLLVSMIFLVVLTLIVVSAIKVTNVNTKLVGNVQVQKEAEAAAQQAIEAVISTDFTKLATPPRMEVDSGQSGSTYTVKLEPPPTCVSVKPIKLSELDASNAEDVPCYASGAAQNTGIAGAGTNGDSLCANSNWEITAVAEPKDATVATTKTTTRQGIATRVALGSSC